MTTQYFVDGMPEMPAPLTQKIVPIWETELPSQGWQPVMKDNEFVGFKNPKLGQFIHSAVIDGEKALYDLILWDDGPIGENGLATPGTVIAPVEKRVDGFYIHCFWQWRPAMGMWVLSLPGGFARFSGESADAVAARESMEESGIRILSFKSAASSCNRANVRTLVNVGFSEFEIVGEKISDELEKITGKFAIRIDQFPWSTDKFTNEAVYLAQKELGLVRPK